MYPLGSYTKCHTNFEFHVFLTHDAHYEIFFAPYGTVSRGWAGGGGACVYVCVCGGGYSLKYYAIAVYAVPQKSTPADKDVFYRGQERRGCFFFKKLCFLVIDRSKIRCFQ